MAEVPTDVQAACERLRQGDILEGVPVVEIADLAQPLGKAAAATAARRREEGHELGVLPVRIDGGYACIVSQTCDIVQPTKPAVVVAVVVPHNDPDDPALMSEDRRAKRRVRIDDTKNGRRPHLVHFDLEHAGFPAGGFVDLKTLTTVQKPILAGKEPLRFLRNEEERRRFSFRCAHVLNRPAIPDVYERTVVASLRSFLIELKDSDPTAFALLRSEICDEWLWLDDHDAPRVGRFYFIGEAVPSNDCRRVLDGWWESAQERLPHDHALLPNEYRALDDVSLAEGRAMSLLTYWYLSDDFPAGFSLRSSEHGIP